MKKLKIAVQVVVCFAMAMTFFRWQNIAAAATDNTRIDQKTAEKIALVNTRHVYPAAKVIYTDAVANYDDGKACQYVVVLAINEEFQGYSKEALLAFYAQNENDGSLTAKLHAGVRSVHISATKDYFPVSIDTSGLPTHTLRRQELRNRAASVLGIDAKNLVDGALVCVYGSGLFQEMKSRDGKRRIFVEVFKLTTLDPVEAGAAMTKGREEVNKGKNDRIERLREDWERYERRIQELDILSGLENVTNASVSATTPVYIANYSDPSLGWSQSEITSHLTCSADGCCFVAAPTSVLSFWDDYQYSQRGPYEGLVPSGEGKNQSAVSSLATDIYNNTAFLGACWDLFFISPCAYQTSGGVNTVAKQRKYVFSTSGMSYPSENNVITEVTNNRPFVWMVGNYTYAPGQSMNHSMACFGYYYDDDNRLRVPCYTNWQHSQTINIYYDNPIDYFDTHAMVSVIPGFAVSHALSNISSTTVPLGGSITYDSTETSSADFAYSYTVSPATVKPDGTLTPGSPVDRTLSAGATETVHHILTVPETAPTGAYSLNVKLTDEYNAVVDLDTFTYTVQ